MDKRKEHRCHGGKVTFWSHFSASTGTTMNFSTFVPESVGPGQKAPVVFWLSGLTCNEENFTTKGAYQRRAAQLGLVVVAPDTSPRGENVPDADSYDLGKGASFYVNATEEPWRQNYQMHDYVVRDLYELIGKEFPVDMQRCGLAGHSMGGHGALVLGIRNPSKFKSISAFAPIAAPSRCPWGEKALRAYLGERSEAWLEYDACCLLEQQGFPGPILVDQGGADEFLERELQPHLLSEAAHQSGARLTFRLQDGYDHSYYFIQSFIEEHLSFHADWFRSL